MRSDYALYVIAVICFVIAGALAAANIPGYTLADASGITVIIIFLLIGIISAAVGYSTKPRAMMPPPQPAPSVPRRIEEEEPTTQTQEGQQETLLPPPAPIEPTPVEEPKLEPERQVIEAQVIAAPEPQSAPATVAPEVEQPVATSEEEKPKPARRRRRKATR